MYIIYIYIYTYIYIIFPFIPFHFKLKLCSRANWRSRCVIKVSNIYFQHMQKEIQRSNENSIYSNSYHIFGGVSYLRILHKQR